MKKLAGISLLIVGLIVLVCVSGCIWPSEQSCYDVAYRTTMTDTNLPKNAVLYPIDRCKVYVCKNAAFVEILYDHSESGRTETDSYSVWLKRIARRWELDYYYPTPKYPQ